MEGVNLVTQGVFWSVVSLILIAMAGMWIFFHRARRETESALYDRAREIEKDFASYKVEVSQGYASHAHLKEVEMRLTKVTGDLSLSVARVAEGVTELSKNIISLEVTIKNFPQKGAV